MLVKALRHRPWHLPHRLWVAPEAVRLDFQAPRVDPLAPHLAQGRHAGVRALGEVIHGVADVVLRGVADEHGILFAMKGDGLCQAEGDDAVRQHHVRCQLQTCVVRDDAKAAEQRPVARVTAGSDLLAEVIEALVKIVAQKPLLSGQEHFLQPLLSTFHILLRSLLRIRRRFRIGGRRPEAEVQLVAPKRSERPQPQHLRRCRNAWRRRPGRTAHGADASKKPQGKALDGALSRRQASLLLRLKPIHICACKGCPDAAVEVELRQQPGGAEPGLLRLHHFSKHLFIPRRQVRVRQGLRILHQA
mmetsp:Transcript_8830/g.33336  ORF Transcript_8830/g.33336 Transcript_8830/m.33336 type:complete len:303 (+) Transcript_8830:1691-2599(+)